MDKSVEWEHHRVEVLAEVGKYEYVRFSGLGEFASYYVYRIEKREMDPELANYCVQGLIFYLPMASIIRTCIVIDSVAPLSKRKKIVKPPNKYRMPNWYAAEVKKAKIRKSAAGRKKAKSKTVTGEMTFLTIYTCAVTYSRSYGYHPLKI